MEVWKDEFRSCVATKSPLAFAVFIKDPDNEDATNGVEQVVQYIHKRPELNLPIKLTTALTVKDNATKTIQNSESTFTISARPRKANLFDSYQFALAMKNG